MKTLTLTETAKIYADSPVLRKPRKCKDSYDFGDQASVGVELKPLGSSPQSPGNKFGRYLGKHNIGYVVAVYDGCSWQISSGEVFETLDEMKQVWMLD